jgi:diadenosine tetraphosphate (Ap4A) HIT family hydrolase
MSACLSCAQDAEDPEAHPEHWIAFDEHWRVAHAINSAIPGWLVLVPRRHVVTIAELTDGEAATLGSWQVRASRALHAVTGCAKTYVVQFAELAGFEHVHFHVVPRDPDLPRELQGPRVFGLLGKPEHPPVPPGEAVRISLALRANF